jgi:transposase
MTELCKEFGISRPLGYKYVRRFKQYGVDGLINISKRPHDIPNKTSLGFSN